MKQLGNQREYVAERTGNLRSDKHVINGQPLPVSSQYNFSTNVLRWKNVKDATPVTDVVKAIFCKTTDFRGFYTQFRRSLKFSRCIKSILHPILLFWTPNWIPRRFPFARLITIVSTGARLGVYYVVRIRIINWSLKSAENEEFIQMWKTECPSRLKGLKYPFTLAWISLLRNAITVYTT